MFPARALRRTSLFVMFGMALVHCSASDGPSDEDGSSTSQRQGGSFDASEATKEGLGVSHWELSKGGDELRGRDDASAIRADFQATMTKGAGGTSEWTVSSTTPAATATFSMTADGAVTFHRNDFASNAAALAAIRLATADARRASGLTVQTKPATGDIHVDVPLVSKCIAIIVIAGTVFGTSQGAEPPPHVPEETCEIRH